MSRREIMEIMAIQICAAKSSGSRSYTILSRRDRPGPGGCYVRRRRLWGGDTMRWQIMLELAGADGTPQRYEVGSGERIPTGHTAATLGFGLEEGKAILAAVQRHLVAAQVDEHCRSRRRCERCGASRPLKDLRPRRLTSLFGVVEVRAPASA